MDKSPGSIVKAVTHFDEDSRDFEVESPKGRAVLPASAKIQRYRHPSPKYSVVVEFGEARISFPTKLMSACFY